MRQKSLVGNTYETKKPSVQDRTAAYKVDEVLDRRLRRKGKSVILKISIPEDSGSIEACTLGVFSALAFTADFSPAALKFHQRTHRVRLKNLSTTAKKSSRKIKHKKIPRIH